jgi:hypothetical protein
MLGLGNSLVTSAAIEQKFDKTFTFLSGDDVADWSFTDTARILSRGYQASQSIGGVVYTNLLKITMVASPATGGLSNITLSDALAGCPDGATLKVEVDYGIGKNNDITLRIATIILGGTFKTVDASDQSNNTFRTVAPVTTSTMGTANNDLSLRLDTNSGLNDGASDVIFVQRIRVYEP